MTAAKSERRLVGTRAAVSRFAYIDTQIEFEQSGSVSGGQLELSALDVKVIVSDSLLQLHGEVGRSITVDVLRWDSDSSHVILRTPHRYAESGASLECADSLQCTQGLHACIYSTQGVRSPHGTCTPRRDSHQATPMHQGIQTHQATRRLQH